MLPRMMPLMAWFGSIAAGYDRFEQDEGKINRPDPWKSNPPAGLFNLKIVKSAGNRDIGKHGNKNKKPVSTEGYRG